METEWWNNLTLALNQIFHILPLHYFSEKLMLFFFFFYKSAKFCSHNPTSYEMFVGCLNPPLVTQKSCCSVLVIICLYYAWICNNYLPPDSLCRPEPQWRSLRLLQNGKTMASEYLAFFTLTEMVCDSLHALTFPLKLMFHKRRLFLSNFNCAAKEPLI